MQLRTEIEKMPSQKQICCRDGIFVLGSCFADNIGRWLEQACLDVCCNPFGVLYNPSSISSAIKSMMSKEVGNRIVQGPDGMYYSFDHHGKFAAQSAEELSSMLAEIHDYSVKSWNSARHILVTFGTSWIYEREGKVVANCHKFPAKEFHRRRLSVEEIVAEWSSLIKKMGDDKHIVFTVSPIRHVKDTLHGNQLSKATLLLAIDQLCTLFPDKVEYLPIYEFLIDDLRDYRFYADDMVHPSNLAIEMVTQYFAENCLDKECQEYIREVLPLVKASQHRPLHPESESYKTFKCQNNLKIDQLQEKYSIFGLSKLKL